MSRKSFVLDLIAVIIAWPGMFIFILLSVTIIGGVCMLLEIKWKGAWSHKVQRKQFQIHLFAPCHGEVVEG